MIDHRVRDTPIALKIELRPDISIEAAALSRTFVQTQRHFRQYIMTHYHADEDVLFLPDDPYTSDKGRKRCFFAITHWPPNRAKRLTYGMVSTALTGLLDMLCRGECNRQRMFEWCMIPRVP